jgi:hypothetical protein
MTVTNGIYLWPFLRNGFEITKGLSEVSVTNDEEYVPFKDRSCSSSDICDVTLLKKK